MQVGDLANVEVRDVKTAFRFSKETQIQLYHTSEYSDLLFDDFFWCPRRQVVY